MTSLLAGCHLGTEPIEPGCLVSYGDQNRQGERMVMYQCWGGADYRDYQ